MAWKKWGKPKKKTTPKLLKDGSVPEKFIQRDILDWLRETGLLFWRQNSGTVFAGHRKILLGDEGMPDIIIILPPMGKILGLEVKSANGRVRPCQKAFAMQMTRSGGIYIVVRTLAQAKEALAMTLGEEQWKLLSSSQARPNPDGST